MQIIQKTLLLSIRKSKGFFGRFSPHLSIIVWYCDLKVELKIKIKKRYYQEF